MLVPATRWACLKGAKVALVYAWMLVWLGEEEETPLAKLLDELKVKAFSKPRKAPTEKPAMPRRLTSGLSAKKISVN